MPMSYWIVLDTDVPPEYRNKLWRYHVTTASQAHLSLVSTEERLRQMSKQGYSVLITSNPDAKGIAERLRIPVTVLQYRGSNSIEHRLLKAQLEIDWRLRREWPESV